MISISRIHLIIWIDFIDADFAISDPDQRQMTNGFVFVCFEAVGRGYELAFREAIFIFARHG